MLDRIISKERLVMLVQSVGRKRTIIAPVARNGHFFYEKVAEADRIRLDFSYCVYGPKRFLFPPDEVLFKFERMERGFAATPVYDTTPLAFVGVHPCDINAIRLLDAVFSRDHRDEHYLRRRKASIIIGVDCPSPCHEGVFCRDMNANRADSGFDLMLFPFRTQDEVAHYGVVFGTDAGREMILYEQAGSDPSVTDERAMERYLREKEAAFPPALSCDIGALPSVMERSYDSLLWEATARRCYSCGSCNLSCPTCYCFNTFDEANLAGTAGVRKREWDGCQLPGFATVAGDHDFRGKPSSRLRHRIFRKARWVQQREGVPGCVGCARCDRACTAKISSVEIYNQLAKEA